MIDTETKGLIAFYNVENLFPPDSPLFRKQNSGISGLFNWNEKRYENKLFKLSRVFSLIQESENVLPFLIGLAEIQGRKPLEDLLALSPFNGNYGIIHYDSMDERGVDVALLYDKSKIEIISSEPITYFFEIEDHISGNYDTTRDVLFCKMKISGAVINVFVVHLPSKREQHVNQPKRNFILKDLKGKILKLKSQNEPVILMGDFNENPDADNLQHLLYDAHFGNFLTNPYEELYKNKIFSTFHFKNGLLFDQIILSSEFFDTHFPVLFKSATVFNPEKLKNRAREFAGRPFRTYAGTRYLAGYSDHFPVFSQFMVKTYKT